MYNLGHIGFDIYSYFWYSSRSIARKLLLISKYIKNLLFVGVIFTFTKVMSSTLSLLFFFYQVWLLVTFLLFYCLSAQCIWMAFHICHSSYLLPRAWQKLGFSSSQPQELMFTWWMLYVRQRAVNRLGFGGIFYFYHPASTGSPRSKFNLLSAWDFQ